VNLGARAASVDLQEGDVARCVFVNAQSAAPTVTTTPSGNPKPAGNSIPFVSANKQARAKFVGVPKACVSKTVHYRIAGAGVQSVRFAFDGKRVATVTKPNAKGEFTYRIDPLLKGAITHRVTARVTFSPDTGAKPVTLHASYKRCTCKSRRDFPIRVREPRGDALRSATVWVNGKQVRTVRGTRIRARVVLRGLHRGAVRVKIRAVTRSGRVITGERVYHPCVERSGRRTVPKL
jgi:hypothetical protein